MADNKLEIDVSANPKGIHKAVTEVEKLGKEIDNITKSIQGFEKESDTLQRRINRMFGFNQKMTPKSAFSSAQVLKKKELGTLGNSVDWLLCQEYLGDSVQKLLTLFFLQYPEKMGVHQVTQTMIG